ncbi:hypothetical protein AcW1_003606 [Taiwanofungus camphoratus]|nr:hypothetical protein AcW1_003606 [Antrodia cinnamomea]
MLSKWRSIQEAAHKPLIYVSPPMNVYIGENLRCFRSSSDHNFPLPHSNHRIPAPYFFTIDFASRNILFDPDTLKMKTFFDPDDMSEMLFVLCARFSQCTSWSLARCTTILGGYGLPLLCPKCHTVDRSLPGDECFEEVERHVNWTYRKD